MKAEQKNTTEQPKKSMRVLSGTVVSAAMDKTIVVKIERRFKHNVVGKTVRTFKKYSVHDENNEASLGDVVEIAECRPLSKTKHMQLQRVVKSAQK